MDNLSVWQPQAEAYREDWDLSQKINFWLSYAILAPSAHNTQPWQCTIKEEQLLVAPDPEYSLKTGDPTKRQTYLSLGAFVENFRLAAAHWGYAATLQSFPLSSPAASPTQTLTLQKTSTPPSTLDEALFKAIPERHTNRGLYLPDPLPEAVLTDFNSFQEPTLKLTLLTEAKLKQEIATLVGKGVAIGLSLSALKEELAEQVSFVKDKAESGMQVESMTEQPATATSGKDWVLQQMSSSAESSFSVQKFAEAPLIIILSSQEDEPTSWIKAGQLLERTLLTGARHGLTHCISAAPVEIPTLAPLLRQLTSDPTLRPQAVVRFGHPQNPSFTLPSPRRPVLRILK